MSRTAYGEIVTTVPLPPEEVEGLDEASALDQMSAYPLDDVMVRSETRTVGDIVKRIEAGRYSMNPDFQRDFVWRPDKQSKLIESCMMRIPLPVLYVAEGEDGRITVVDGLQRLSTFQAFLSNKLRLTGLGTGHPLEGKRFNDLPINLQERVEDTQLTLYILDKSAPEAARLDIFDRVNSGIPLSRQQMRNALYNGKATRWLAQMADEAQFLSVTGGSLSRLTMRDREAINRFLGFHLLDWRNYSSGDIDVFLAQALSNLNKQDDEQITQLSEEFLASMHRNEMLFGRHAFRKSLVETKLEERALLAYRSVINISFFDVLSVFFVKISDQQLHTDGDAIRSKVIGLLANERFVHSITYSTNSTVQVQTRFTIMSNALSEWLL
jgi:hypothetical protein